MIMESEDITKDHDEDYVDRFLIDNFIPYYLFYDIPEYNPEKEI